MRLRNYAITISVILGFSGIVHAEDFPQRTELNNRSLSRGFSNSSVELLRRLPGPGIKATSQKIIRHFVDKKTGFSLNGSFTTVKQTDRKIRVIGERGWSIRLKGDGSAAKVSNYDYLDKSLRVLPTDRPQLDILETMGRRFVETELKDFVRLGKDEELVPMKTEYQIDDEGRGNETLKEELVASTIIFGRRVGGVDVLGAGSKVMVTFANDGIPVAFAYDWPEYRATGQKQDVLDISLIRERASALATMRFGSESVDIRRFECGYVDRGARRARSDLQAPIQAGCWVTYVGSRTAPNYVPKAGDHPSYGIQQTATGDAIPAGKTVEMDYDWPHVINIIEHGDVCAVSELTPAIIPPNTP